MAAMWGPLRDAWQRLSAGQKLRLVLAVAGLVALVWGVSLYATRARYGVLFSHLDPGDAAQVMAALRERRVPYRLEAGGTVIEVPVERVDELRIELAGDGLPRGGGVGFEIFDKPAFGMSDFVQNVNYRRALERELARSIQTLEVVESARVHLALPRPSVFAGETREPSASVVLRLRGTSSLPPERTRAIAHLVASGVDGLEAQHVSIVDAQGRILHAGGEPEMMGLTASQLEAKQQMERRIERTLVSILEPVVGPGRVRASATVELDYRKVERVEESFDPESAVVRSEVRTKTRSDAGGPGGVPGTASNLPDAAGGGVTAGALGSHESQSTTTNFEVAKTVATIQEPVGRLVRQSVAVVVDNAVVTRTDEQGRTVQEAAPRSEEEMDRIREIVRAAVGYDPSRGDVLIVQNVPFEVAPVEPAAETATGAWFDLALRIARFVALPLAVLLIILLVVRPGIATLRELRAGGGTTGALPATVAELQARLASGEAGPGTRAPGLRARLIQAAAEDPQAAALVVRSWLQERRG